MRLTRIGSYRDFERYSNCLALNFSLTGKPLHPKEMDHLLTEIEDE